MPRILAANIGRPVRKIRVEPMPQPVKEPAREPDREPAPKRREKVPA